MRIADHQFDPIKAARAQRTQEVHPEGFSLRRPNAKANDFAAPIGIGGDSDYGGHADDPPALSLLEIGGVEPDIRPFPGQWAVQELVYALVDILALWGTILFFVAAARRSSHTASGLFVPYLLWVGLAGMLNWSIVRLNRPF